MVVHILLFQKKLDNIGFKNFEDVKYKSCKYLI